MCTNKHSNLQTIAEAVKIVATIDKRDRVAICKYGARKKAANSNSSNFKFINKNSKIISKITLAFLKLCNINNYD